jgi:multidrug efflux pump subunit AcrA (membrane-fusion protein)
MKRLVFLLTLSICATAYADKLPANPYQRPVLFTGELQAVDSVPIIVPPSNVSPVTLRYFVPEGSKVKTGDVILRVDSQGNAELERLELELVQVRERGLREAADLDVKTVEAERALITARAALAKAKIDAALPKAQISALDRKKTRNLRSSVNWKMAIWQLNACKFRLRLPNFNNHKAR